VSNKSNDQGFVLPYVLAVIAILAMMLTAESDAIYALLTGITLEGGVDLNSDNPIETEFGVIDSSGNLSLTRAEDRQDKIVRDIWSANGGMRYSKQLDDKVYIQLRDVYGYISLSSVNSDNLSRLLNALGVSKASAHGLIAKLSDYTDMDNKRQFKGAERADYRLRNKPAPSNSPLRNYDELAHVLGWNDVLENIDVIRLKNLTTLQNTTDVKIRYANFEVQDILKSKTEKPKSIETGFSFEDLEINNSVMSDNSRLTFWVKTQAGLYRKRVIEIRRDTNNIAKPFRKFWVYETTVSKNDLNLDGNSRNEIRNVFNTASIHLQ